MAQVTKNSICIDSDLMPASFLSKKGRVVEILGAFNVYKMYKTYKNFINKPKSLRELFALNQICYFMVRNAFMSERRLSRAEREKYILPISKQWADHVFIGGRKDLPDWVAIVREHFESLFNGTTAFERLSKIKLDVKYTKTPILEIDTKGNGRLSFSVVLMAFLMQLNYSYLFFMKIDDKEEREYEIRQKMIPLLVFQSNPIETSIAGLPVLYGLNQFETEYAKQLSMYQMYYLMLHEIGHIECGHVRGKQPKVKLHSSIGPKEIEADVYAYGVMEQLEGEQQFDMAASIVSLLSFYTLSEELKLKTRGQDDSPNYIVLRDKLHCAKINMRHAISKFGSDAIDKTSYDAVDDAATRHLLYSLHPLGIVQKTLNDITAEELRELCSRYTDENITKYWEENEDAANKN